MKIVPLLIFCLIPFLAGCATDGPYTPPVTEKIFSAPIAEKLVVETGGVLFVEGKYVDGKKIKIDDPQNLMIPGSMFVPFPVFIDAGFLEMTGMTSNWDYFCGKESKVKASFPGLGSVIASGDCVGIRVSRDGKKSQWVVDNSNYNNMNTIWTRSLTKEEMKRFFVESSSRPYRVVTLKRISFDGYYGGQLHFSFEEHVGRSVTTDNFTFDFDGTSTRVGIKGNIFTVHEANNVNLIYEWEKIK